MTSCLQNGEFSAEIDIEHGDSPIRRPVSCSAIAAGSDAAASDFERRSTPRPHTGHCAAGAAMGCDRTYARAAPGYRVAVVACALGLPHLHQEPPTDHVGKRLEAAKQPTFDGKTFADQHWLLHPAEPHAGRCATSKTPTSSCHRRLCHRRSRWRHHQRRTGSGRRENAAMRKRLRHSRRHQGRRQGRGSPHDVPHRTTGHPLCTYAQQRQRARWTRRLGLRTRGIPRRLAHRRGVLSPIRQGGSPPRKPLVVDRPFDAGMNREPGTLV